MYQYNDFDKELVQQRAAQFRQQTKRYLDKKIPEEEFRPLRLQNGLYVQRFAPMLRIAVPYGTLSSTQLRKLGDIATRYDKGWGHFTTRQNLQLNWPTLESVPDILDDLASVEMHAIQTSGNCIRNVTSDELAGVAPDELEDPRPYCEILRQWSTLHPEFAYLPRKFKIAVSSTSTDRAAIRVHDIGLQLRYNDAGEVGFQVFVGGGLGRTPILGQAIHDFVPEIHLISYLEAILRVYNRLGRRDNKHKARIKILVRSMGIEAFKELAEAEWEHLKGGELTLKPSFIANMKTFFKPPAYEALDNCLDSLPSDNSFQAWLKTNTRQHKVAGYRAVYATLKSKNMAPGDCSSEQMQALAELADEYSFAEVRTTHAQNLVLADVPQSRLHELWQKLAALDLATPNLGKATDMICCPGLDFCSLANAGAINVANDLNERIDDLDYLYDLGDIRINISGCMNGCGHHSVGHIGVLGVDKKGKEWYQLTLGGSSSSDAALGDRLGAAIDKEQVADTIIDILNVYVEQRGEEERFLDTYRRVGITPFRERIYG